MERFPIMIGYRGTIGPCPSSIPWDSIAPYEGQAKINHQQTIEGLASRGGLGPIEAFLVMTGRTWDRINFSSDDFRREACAFLDKIVKDEGALALQNHELRKALIRVGAKTFQSTDPNSDCVAVNKALALTPTKAEKEVEFLLELEKDSRVEHDKCRETDCSICYGLAMLEKLRKGE